MHNGQLHSTAGQRSSDALFLIFEAFENAVYKFLDACRSGFLVCVCFSSSAVCRKYFFNTLRAVAIATALNHNSIKLFQVGSIYGI